MTIEKKNQEEGLIQSMDKLIGYFAFLKPYVTCSIQMHWLTLILSK